MKLTDEVDYELVYDAAAFKDIKEQWPQAEQEDARDMIHLDRIVVKIPGVTYDEFYRHSLDKGYCRTCLSFEMNLLGGRNKHPEFYDLVDEWIAARKNKGL